MALVDNAWYVNFGNGSSTGYYAVMAWATGATIAAGALRRQLAAPAVGSERVFVCVVAGTTHATTEPTWVITRGGKTTDNTVTWQECTGIAALNGDATNTPSWTITATPPGGVKNTAVTLGQVIKRDNGASYWICTTAGTAGNGSEPAWANDTAGTTRTDNTVTWTCLGVVGNFTGWQAPHARLANSLATNWGQASNSFYVGDNHAETQSTALALTFPGAAATLNKVYCVNHSGSLPPVSADLMTTATVTTTGNTAMTIGSGFAYIYGISFFCGTGAVTPNFTLTLTGYYKNCAFKAGTSAVLFLLPGANPQTWDNVVLGFGTASGVIRPQGIIKWINTASALSGTAPTNIFDVRSPCVVSVIGVDLSATTANLVTGANATAPCSVQFLNCKLGAAVTPYVAGSPGQNVDVIVSDSAAVNYRQQRHGYSGSSVNETTIVRTGGATDGTTPISWKIVTTANSKWIVPFESQPITIWNDSTSSVTVTVYGIWGGGAVPNNDDIWIEAEYLGSSATPLGSFATATKADNLATGSALTSDSSTWGGSTTKFKMSVTFTPGMKGPINLVVKAAKLSSTFYIDPKPVLT